VLACADSPEDPGETASTVTQDDDGSATSSSEGGSTSADTSGATTQGSADTSTGDPIQFCGLDDLAAAAPDPIEHGSGAMQIPSDVAALLVGNCGCHLADGLDVDAPDYPSTGPFDMTTWAGFQAMRPTDGMPWHVVAHTNVMTEFMPLSTFCNVGAGEGMPVDQREVLVAWLAEGAPDGATWVPGG
jgi:hypothetical protein